MGLLGLQGPARGSPGLCWLRRQGPASFSALGWTWPVTQHTDQMLSYLLPGRSLESDFNNQVRLSSSFPDRCSVSGCSGP